MHIIALEGPSYSGKSTLAQGLKRELQSQYKVAILHDYVVAAGGSERIPYTPAKTPEEEIEALKFFLDLDQHRWMKGLSKCKNPKIVLIDRSVHTLLAHRFALTQTTELSVFSRSCQIALEHSGVIWPQRVFYIDITQEGLNARYRKYRPGSRRKCQKHVEIFQDPNYNEAFRGYFIPKIQYTSTPVIIFDGLSSRDVLIHNVLRYIRIVIG